MIQPSLCTRTIRLTRSAAFALVASIALTSDAGAQRLLVRVRMQAFPHEIALDTLAFSKEVLAATPQAVFAAVQGVYTELKVPREIADSLAGVVGARRFRTSGSIGGERYSVYLNCGEGLTGANADVWRLTIAIATFIEPVGEGRTRIGTGFVAAAQDMGGASKDPVACGSFGLLESRIARMVKEKLGLK